MGFSTDTTLIMRDGRFDGLAWREKEFLSLSSCEVVRYHGLGVETRGKHTIQGAGRRDRRFEQRQTTRCQRGKPKEVEVEMTSNNSKTEATEDFDGSKEYHHVEKREL